MLIKIDKFGGNLLLIEMSHFVFHLEHKLILKRDVILMLISV